MTIAEFRDSPGTQGVFIEAAMKFLTATDDYGSVSMVTPHSWREDLDMPEETEVKFQFYMNGCATIDMGPDHLPLIAQDVEFILQQFRAKKVDDARRRFQDTLEELSDLLDQDIIVSFQNRVTEGNGDIELATEVEDEQPN